MLPSSGRKSAHWAGSYQQLLAGERRGGDPGTHPAGCRGVAPKVLSNEIRTKSKYVSGPGDKCLALTTL